MKELANKLTIQCVREQLEKYPIFDQEYLQGEAFVDFVLDRTEMKLSVNEIAHELKCLAGIGA